MPFSRRRLSAVVLALSTVMFLPRPGSLGVSARTIAQTVKNPDGSTTTTTKIDKYGGGTNVTTRDAKGDLTEEIEKDKAGTMRYFKSLTKKDNGDVEYYEATFRPDGTCFQAKTTTTHQNGGTTNEWIIYELDGFHVVAGSKTGTDANGGTINYHYDPTTAQWLETVPLSPERQKMLEDIFNKFDFDQVDKKPWPNYLNWPRNPAPPSTSQTGYQVDTVSGNGLNTIVFSTPSGRINVNLSDDLAASDTLSGTVEELPSGRDDAERNQNRTILGGYAFEFQQQKTPVGEQRFTRQMPATLTPAARTIVLSLNGKTVATAGVPIAPVQPPTPLSVTLPTGGQQSRPIVISEPCNGIFDAGDSVKIGDTTLPVLAESPRQKVLRNTSEVVGPATLEDRENGRVTRITFRNLGIKLSAPLLSLLRGQTTTLTTTVLGLAGISENVPLDLVNSSSTVISLAGGNDQHITITPGEVKADGTYSLERTLTGIRAGSFGITGTVRWTAVQVESLGSQNTVNPSAASARDRSFRNYVDKQRALDAVEQRWLEAVKDGMSTANKDRIKVYDQARQQSLEDLMKWYQAGQQYVQDATDANKRAVAEAAAKQQDASRKWLDAKRAVIDSMAGEKKAACQNAEAAVMRARADGEAARSEYLTIK